MRFGSQNLRSIVCRSVPVAGLKSPGSAFHARKKQERAGADLEARGAALRARLVAKFGDRHPAVVALDEVEARARTAVG